MLRSRRVWYFSAEVLLARKELVSDEACSIRNGRTARSTLLKYGARPCSSTWPAQSQLLSSLREDCYTPNTKESGQACPPIKLCAGEEAAEFRQAQTKSWKNVLLTLYQSRNKAQCRAPLCFPAILNHNWFAEKSKGGDWQPGWSGDNDGSGVIGLTEAFERRKALDMINDNVRFRTLSLYFVHDKITAAGKSATKDHDVRFSW